MAADYKLEQILNRTQASIMHSSVWTSMTEVIQLFGPSFVLYGGFVNLTFIASKG